ncbi:hypothetical protein [Legionella brunensis]|nr:hypothetical protein [Legionella brunensis]
MHNLLHTKFFKESDKTSHKVIIIELYSCYLEENLEGDVDKMDFDRKNFEHEIVANGEIGHSFRHRYNQKDHFIYTVSEKVELTLKKQEKQSLNLTDPKILHRLHQQLNPGDTLIFIAQGNPVEEKLAGLDSEAFIELIHEDLELENFNIHLEIYSCKMGNAYSFRADLIVGLSSSCKTITTYKVLLAANELGRVFIQEGGKNDYDHFYGEEKIDLFRIIDKTTIVEEPPLSPPKN